MTKTVIGRTGLKPYVGKFFAATIGDDKVFGIIVQRGYGGNTNDSIYLEFYDRYNNTPQWEMQEFMRYVVKGTKAQLKEASISDFSIISQVQYNKFLKEILADKLKLDSYSINESITKDGSDVLYSFGCGAVSIRRTQIRNYLKVKAKMKKDPALNDYFYVEGLINGNDIAITDSVEQVVKLLAK